MMRATIVCVLASLCGLGATAPRALAETSRVGGDDYDIVRLAESKLGFVDAGGQVNILRGNKTVGSGAVYERFNGATYLPAAGVALLDSYRPSDMCADYMVTVVPVKRE